MCVTRLDLSEVPLTITAGFIICYQLMSYVWSAKKTRNSVAMTTQHSSASRVVVLLINKL